MTEPADRPNITYLSLITPPPGVEGDALAELVARMTGLDVHTLKLRLRTPPPLILGETTREQAGAGVRAIIGAGGDAFAPQFSHIEAFGSSLKIKDLEPEGSDSIRIALWRGPECTIRPSGIQLLVRGAVQIPRAREVRVERGFGLQGAAVLGVGGAVAVAAAGAAEGAGASVGPRQFDSSHRLDIHMTDRNIFQIDGDKFAYRALGKQRGHSDLVNMDRMLDFLHHLAPNAIVDTYFKNWSPPPSVRFLRLPDVKLNNENPTFAFYSRWAALMYRHVMRKVAPVSPSTSSRA